MKNRVCRLFMEIGVEGSEKKYFLSPLTGEALGTGFVAGFKVVNRTDDPSPIYLVRVDAEGAASCNCPAFHWEIRKGQAPSAPPDQPPPSCKHTEAMCAAGLLPVDWIKLIRERTKLLDIAERKVRNRDLEREASLRNTDSLRKQIAELERERNEILHRANQLQTSLAAVTAAGPKRRTRKAKAAA